MLGVADKLIKLLSTDLHESCHVMSCHITDEFLGPWALFSLCEMTETTERSANRKGIVENLGFKVISCKMLLTPLKCFVVEAELVCPVYLSVISASCCSMISTVAASTVSIEQCYLVLVLYSVQCTVYSAV